MRSVSPRQKLTIRLAVLFFNMNLSLLFGFPANYQQMQNCWPVGLQLGGQTIAVPSLADNAAGCTQITMIMAIQKLSFVIRIAVLFFDMASVLSVLCFHAT